MCYSKEHDHPPGPGRWQTEAMKTLFRKIRQEWKAMGGAHRARAAKRQPQSPSWASFLLTTCASASALFTGEPVPVYQYVYHEYRVNNFMGNQNFSGQSIDLLKSPDKLLCADRLSSWREICSVHGRARTRRGDQLGLGDGNGDYPAPDHPAISAP
ncbi:DUF6259 domain-containing protein [Cohnella rhizosphaerae]|uniref:DUF6259 domain-containing protein n=1 Tax=Cohnella rhizosphaerae TaxID=1457232 RepID=A0A9X4KQ84_9BACL|nr:DUF6259 domain-containing protein [Cohnella rhizosphaerae]MDG0808890.1 DUF6259 domain-containing protein [Cohnella rhizosphaerae]